MKAGRELDAMVAEKVMGWTCRDSEYSPWQDKDENRFDLPQFSTDVAAAWQVVEKMTEIGCGYFNLRWIPSMQSWQAIIDQTFPRDRINGPYCPTAPEAICRAALESVGVKP